MAKPRKGLELHYQCRSKNKISGGGGEYASAGGTSRWGGLGANLKAWKCYFQRSPRAICDLRISQIIYFVHCLSKPMHIESITLETDYLCILKAANVSPFRVIIISS